MELPTVTSETVEEATIYEQPKKAKRKMPKTKKTLPRALFTIFNMKPSGLYAELCMFFFVVFFLNDLINII